MLLWEMINPWVVTASLRHAAVHYFPVTAQHIDLLLVYYFLYHSQSLLPAKDTETLSQRWSLYGFIVASELCVLNIVTCLR